MKRTVFLIGFCWLMVCARAQDRTILYVSTTGNAEWAGTAAEPLTLTAAVNKANADGTILEIRLSLSQDGKAVYPLTEELILREGLTLAGGYAYRGEERVINPAEKIVLQGNGEHRVVTVGKNAVLDGVTVTGGKTHGENGGGVYVKEGGMVRNCIITENVAALLMPREGDLLMADGSFLSPDEFTYDKKDEVKGVIFWVNPDRAATDVRGCAVACKAVNNQVFFSKNTALTVTGYSTYATLDLAVTDLDGETTCSILKQDASANAVKLAADKGEGYFLPSLGILMRLMAEQGIVDKTFNTLYDVLKAKSTNITADYAELFGQGYAAEWVETTHFIHTSTTMIWSSTLSSSSKVWTLRGGLYANETSSEAIEEVGADALNATAFVISVINF